MNRSLLVQTLLDMATGSGGAKLEALTVDAAGIFDAGSGKGYNPVTVPSGGHSASAHKGVMTDHSIIVTPRSTATQGFVQAGTVEGAGVSVSASELVSGTQSIISNGAYDVTNLSGVNVDVATSLNAVLNIPIEGSNNHELIIPYSGDFNELKLITVFINYGTTGTPDAYDIRACWWIKGMMSGYSNCITGNYIGTLSASLYDSSVLLSASNQNFRFNQYLFYTVVLFK